MLKGFLSGSSKKGKTKPQPKAVVQAEVESAVPVEDTRIYEHGTWPIERQKILESVWGEGNLQPGSHETVVAAMNACALTSAKSMLDMRAGLGGGARALVEKFGVWLVGLDANEEFVKEANNRSLRQSLEKKAIFHQCDSESIALKPSGYDAILCRKFLSSISNKDNAYEQMAVGLKPSGHLVLIDYVLGKPKGHEALLDAMLKKETPDLRLCPASHIANGLKKNNFMIHVAADVTEDYVHAAEADWALYRDSLKHAEISPFAAQIILNECDCWDARAAAMKAGAVKVYRFYATNSAEQKKGRVNTMSNWKY